MMSHIRSTALVAFVLLALSSFVVAMPPPQGSKYASRARIPTAQRQISCDIDTRTLDGQCTNPTDPSWSATDTAQFSYIEGHSSNTPTGENLPSPRLISNTLCMQSEDLFNDREISEFFTFFGQLVDHDLYLTPTSEDEFPIAIGPEDEIFGMFPGDVLEFTRSERVPIVEGEIAERPVNTVSGALDLSTVYGSSEERNAALREENSCKLLVSEGDLLPFNTMQIPNSPTTDPGMFVAGDTRSNEHPVLATMHTLFVREHNYICDQLAVMMPNTTAEEQYENARTINIAEFQDVVYDEFFPALIGRTLAPYEGFDPSVDPTPSNVYGAAGFRIGHTLVGNSLSRAGPGNAPLEPVPMEEMFFRSTELLTDLGIEEFMRGSMQTTAQEVDIMIHDALRNFLFSEVEEEEGFDLIALNLQRGRDHAIPKFNELRVALNMEPLGSFAELTANEEVQAGMEEVYGTIDDVEVWIGMVAEDHMPDSSVGPTMGELWRTEYTRIRDGDMFFYQNSETFPAELAELPLITRLDEPGSVLRDIIIRNSEITEEEMNDSPFFTS